MRKFAVAVAVLLLMESAAWANEGVPATAGKLVAHYTFDEGSGTTAHDTSGNANDGKIHGAEFVKVGDGYALRFDGVDDYVDCGSDKSLDLREALTIEAWIHPDGIQGQPMKECGLVGKGFSSYCLVSWLDAQCHFWAAGSRSNPVA